MFQKGNFMNSSLYISTSKLWQTSLGNKSKWSFDELRNKLIVAFSAFRDNVAILAEEISRDLPDFTVHDITHIDSLWEFASIIAGDKYIINPMEAFVLGGAILLHDLGMASAAYAEGIDSLKKGVEWEDTIELALRNYLKRTPTDDERKSPPSEVIVDAIENRLRSLHAVHAEKLPSIQWRTDDGKSYRLLDDSILLDHYGETIGKIAASHWWSIEKVANELDLTIGAPPSYPYQWEVDVLKLSCILRVADAANIDSRRADGFRRSLRKRNENSELHWIFQNHLARPAVKGNQLVYSSTRKFTDMEIEAWWVGYDILKMIHKELVNVHALLKDTGRPTFDVNGVANADNPGKLCKQIQVSGWEPINAMIHISNIPKLVKNLGGEALYGHNPTIPLRELIQNACDAIEARRKLQRLENSFGKIIVKLCNSDNDCFIEIEDNGIGMSQRALIEKLLDFGDSYWESSLVMEEHKGLLSSGFKPIGKFGIGFFSVFMISDNIEVTSRSIHSSPEETYILSFGKGLSKRPVLRKANYDQRLFEVGTRVRINLESINEFEIICEYFSRRNEEIPESMNDKLAYICRKIAPSINTNLYCKVLEGIEELVINANDWIEIDSTSLLLRMNGYSKNNAPRYLIENALTYSDLIKPIIDLEGKTIARACISIFEWDENGFRDGVITCGGLYLNSIRHLSGLFCGQVNGASRNSGEPIAKQDLLRKWASKQAKLIMAKFYNVDKKVLCEASAIVHYLGGNTADLPICETHYGWMSYKDLVEKEWPNEVGIVQDATKSLSNVHTLPPDIISVNVGQPGVGVGMYEDEWPYGSDDDEWFHTYTLKGLVIKALAESWETTLVKVKKSSQFSDDSNEYKMFIGKDNLGNRVIERVSIIRNPNSDN